MPSISLNWLRYHLKNENIEKVYPVFVETGTYMGETIIPLETHFKELHTIEVKKDIYDHVKQKSNKINFYLGDSSKVLANLCPNIKHPTIFFLDGHWSAGITGKGEKDCPLYEELQCIMSSFNQDCIIIIDDCRLFGKGPNKKNEICNWEDINTETILKIVHSKMNNHYFCPSDVCENDRLILFLHK